MQTSRLYFRQFTLADADLLYRMHQDPAITRYTGDPIPWESVARAEQVLADVILPQYENGIGRWAVHLLADDTFIGWCGLKQIGEEIDIGYRYIQKFWGQGYATEAAQAVLEYGKSLQLPRIIGRADAANLASVKVFKKIGLTFKESYTDENTKTDSVKYILKS